MARDSNFNINLKKARELKGFSQKDVAENIGISKSTYSLYESGNRAPNIQIIKKMIDFLDVSADSLFGVSSIDTTPSIQTLYDRIKLLRIRHGYSQEQLALMVGYADKTSIAKIESGKVDLPLSKIIAFSKFLNTTTSYLLEGDNTQDNMYNKNPKESDHEALGSNLLIGQRIKECRKIKKLTLEDIANKTGIAKSTIQRYETGKIGKIKIPVLRSIANALNINPDWLLGKTDEIDTTIEKILNYYDILNDEGKKELLKRSEELTYVPKYVIDSESQNTDFDLNLIS